MASSGSLKKDVSVLASSKLANQGVSKKLKLEHEPTSSTSSPMEKLLFGNVTEQCEALAKASQAAKGKAPETRFIARDLPTSSSQPISPSLESVNAATASRSSSITPSIVVSDTTSGSDEVLRLRRELAQAQSKISRLEELHRFATKESGRITPGPSTSATSPPIVPPPIQAGFSFGLTNKPMVPREQGWMEEGNTADVYTSTRNKGIWNNHSSFGNPYNGGHISMEDRPVRWHNNRQVFDASHRQAPTAYRLQYESGSNNTTNTDTTPTDVEFPRPRRPHQRQSNNDNQYVPATTYGNPYGGYGMPNSYEPLNNFGPPGVVSGSMGMNMYPFPQQQVGTTLSPHATEFTTNAPWKTEHVTAEGQTFIPSTEPLNYRRLLDRNVTCDWKYIVDKIVCNNDQQASIFLQQKLKVSTPEQKYDIVEAIVAQAYPLMVNRFGNFLVQRCFEHGTPEQVIKIAEAIRGNTLNLSIDPFGCHVVQKAFDSVPEDYKAIMVHELLRRIPETVIHRYACHVWQKLFELRWTESPPQIMTYVNEALRGMWHEVALGETGSLVVQNIFENCLEEDKRPCIEEVLANIDIVAHGQFGNWCIQHICEHGAPADRSRAVDHVIRYAAEYSMDQFASKVVEKCLKIGGTDFLSRYLERVCEGRMDRTRIPLIDIASDQYGNYLIQYILTHAQPQHREIVAAHIRKHMVSLRGSKFGSRVGMLCTNPAVVTRPGPGIGPSQMGAPNRMNATPRYGAPYR